MQKIKQDEKRVLVIGGGVGGIKAALDLSESRKKVLLIDSDYAIGGLMTQLDRTFPTNNCDLCTVSPHLSATTREKFLQVSPMTELTSLSGEAGDFTATLKTAPRFIDIDKCTACGECLKKFPEAVRFTPGLDPRAPTCMRYPQATPYAYSIDMEKIDDVEALKGVCKAGAIIADDSEQEIQIKVASVVLSVGAELFDPSVLDNFGGGKFANVVTGLEYERIMSASGPYQGNLVKKSDEQPPKKVAWIQCVGSRGINRHDVSYCSSVCCMYALKEAMVTKERFGKDIETTIFFMDMRTFGKDYEPYYNRAKEDFGIRLIRCKPHTIIELPDKSLQITYAKEELSAMIKEDFDMVVLSTGFRPTQKTIDLAGTLGIDLNEHNFAKSGTMDPVTTSKDGVYVCGVFESPKDIPETLVQASAAASLAGAAIESEECVEDASPYPPQRDVDGEDPKIGVFIVDCDGEIGQAMDINKILENAKSNPDVAVAEAFKLSCSFEAMEKIENLIKEQALNRVVIGSGSPRVQEIMFQDMLRRAGLNPYLLELVNLRDQAAWAHNDAPAKALEKAFQLVQVGISGVRKAKALPENILPTSQNALVVGGGVTGMTSALELADQGTFTYLVEKAPVLGGQALNLSKTIEGDDVAAFVKDLVGKVYANENIKVFTDAVVAEHNGVPGRFTTGIKTSADAYEQIDHGVTILATGATPNRPAVYGLGELDKVMTQLDLDSILENDESKIKAMEQVVMIQCAGSREADNPNCSRLCCQAAVKNALRLLEVNPDINVFVLYRDIRTYGFQEDYYKTARDKGVKFIRFDLDHRPVVREEAGKTIVRTHDFILGQDIDIEADCVALSTGLVANSDTNKELARLFNLPKTEDGFFLEDHVKLKPVDMALRGFFVAGTAHSPKVIRESITQAHAVAGRARTMLANKEITLGAAYATVDPIKCAVCLICVRVCPFNVPFINNERHSEISPAKCHGCGICVAECPAKAIQLRGWEDDQMLAKLDGLFERYN
ncbi:FAD-dependent oxidoreductase [Desulfobacter postgatei]|jgi:heterodisulfide reductase subunit A|uniref:FAD-dependent oxidoreductase n=1 Tax=Desulfobacter postgatei TaxID=2293 RepID=UPI002A36DD86|nr:FAD-dependent oxidoreductase [Desulfobacter postgatei]MDX9964834.1 FAD-dependent oxidoreductase [Desulfobacter postgatei]